MRASLKGYMPYTAGIDTELRGRTVASREDERVISDSRRRILDVGV